MRTGCRANSVHLRPASLTLIMVNTVGLFSALSLSTPKKIPHLQQIFVLKYLRPNQIFSTQCLLNFLMGLEKAVEGGPEAASLCKEEAIQAAEVAKQSAMKAAAASQKAINLVQTAKDVSEGKAVIPSPKADKGKAPPAPPTAKGGKGPDKAEVVYENLLLSFKREKREEMTQMLPLESCIMVLLHL